MDRQAHLLSALPMSLVAGCGAAPVRAGLRALAIGVAASAGGLSAAAGTPALPPGLQGALEACMLPDADLATRISALEAAGWSRAGTSRHADVAAALAPGVLVLILGHFLLDDGQGPVAERAALDELTAGMSERGEKDGELWFVPRDLPGALRLSYGFGNGLCMIAAQATAEDIAAALDWPLTARRQSALTIAEIGSGAEVADRLIHVTIADDAFAGFVALPQIVTPQVRTPD